MLVPYTKEYEYFGYCYLRPLKPTGKYRVESGPGYKDRMSIQHKGLLFKKWVPEEDIVFKEEFSRTEYDCKKR